MMKRLILATGLVVGSVAMTVATPAFAQDDIVKKLQDRIASLTTEQQAALLLLLDQLDGAGESAVATSEEKSLRELGEEGIQQWIGFANKGDINGMMSTVSEDFEHYVYGDKAGLQGFVQQALDMGYLKDLEASTEDTEIEEEDDGTIIAYPVDIEGTFGVITFEFVMKKEDDGEYRMVGMDVSGL
jgi:hypothetical protein